METWQIAVGLALLWVAGLALAVYAASRAAARLRELDLGDEDEGGSLAAYDLGTFGEWGAPLPLSVERFLTEEQVERLRDRAAASDLHEEP